MVYDTPYFQGKTILQNIPTWAPWIKPPMVCWTPRSTTPTLASRHFPHRRVPLVWDEYSLAWTCQSPETRQWNNIGAVWMASALEHMADAGVEMASQWNLLLLNKADVPVRVMVRMSGPGSWCQGRMTVLRLDGSGRTRGELSVSNLPSGIVLPPHSLELLRR